MITSLLIANRGEIAGRVIRTAKRLGVRTVAIATDPDLDLPYARKADEVVELGAPAPATSYLDADRLLAIAVDHAVDAIHPGYGFLSENANFAQVVGDAGIIWVGPTPDAMRAMGNKATARALMAKAGVAVAAGSIEPVLDVGAALEVAHEIGYPVMVKATAGGGGIGMSAARDDDELRAAFTTARARAERFFSDPGVLIERFIERARHLEVQILGLTDGQIVAVGVRDCSVQRRHQKVIEESPPANVTPALLERLTSMAVNAGEAVSYRNAGTVESLYDNDRDEIVFLEMNTRLQVEHPVTEMVTGLDLVEEQLRIASGLAPTFDPREPIKTYGHAIELRVYAEDSVSFLPRPGTITEWVMPAGPDVRVDAGYAVGNTVTAFYDPLLAKVVVWGADRDEARHRAQIAADGIAVTGPQCNVSFLVAALADPEFAAGTYDTGVVSRILTRG